MRGSSLGCWREAAIDEHINRLEKLLAEGTKAYIDEFRGTENEQPRVLRDLCSVLERLLDGRLHQDERWDANQWVDGILPEYAAATSPHEIVLRGIMIWNDGGRSSGEWIEPFSASVRVSVDGATIEDYELMCSDRARGLKATPYGNKLPPESTREWMFIFRWPGIASTE